MFETLDIMIALAVVFLILSMVHKYLVSPVKRMLSIKAKVVAEEMETFIGENTVQSYYFFRILVLCVAIVQEYWCYLSCHISRACNIWVIHAAPNAM